MNLDNTGLLFSPWDVKIIPMTQFLFATCPPSEAVKCPFIEI